MIFPPNFEEKIGFDHIRQMLVDMCVSSMGKEYVEKMRFETVFNRIGRKVSQVFEFLEILKYEQPFPAQNYFNLIPELQRIRLSGTYILQEQLFDLKSSLESLNEVIVYLQKLDSAKYTLLSELVEDKRVDRVILNEIYSIIDEKGNIKDTASETLRDIRQRLIKLSGEIEKAVRQVLVTAKKSGWLNPNDEITIRNGRMVIPVPAANKRKIRGFVHDESATGQTVYIEPAEALDANNEILELRNAEKREIIRILTSFTDNLRPKIEELIEGYRFLGLIDFIRAKALLAGKINGTKPFMSNEPLIDWRKALHPLLFLVHQKQKKHVEPLDILLNKENRILIISGPNAGGKSVCLKTTGLIQYMLQCGLLVPMDDNSKTGVFKDIFIDIGDEQSIEDDLSTYTSHLRNMKGNLVAVISNGTAVLGLGDIGTLASKPVMEGKGFLFKIFADIDVFDIEIDLKDPQKFVDTVVAIAPTFGGINLEDIKAPECFEIEEKIQAAVDIPVMHDDQHGTAIITAAGLLNAVKLTGKKIEDLKIVVNGAGASAISCTRLYIKLGVRPENIVMIDSKGVLRKDRTDLNYVKQQNTTDRDIYTLEEAIEGADMFLGLSAAGALKKEYLKKMAPNPIVFAQDPYEACKLCLTSRKCNCLHCYNRCRTS